MPAATPEQSSAPVECPECFGVRNDDDRLCPTCEGNCLVTPERARNYFESLHETAARCESCGELSADLQEVEDSDPDVGYSDFRLVSRVCCRRQHQIEAEMDGGLRMDALELLGVAEVWLADEVPRKPAALARNSAGGVDRKAGLHQ